MKSLLALLAPTLLVSAAVPQPNNDLIVQAGTTLQYDTSFGALFLDKLIIGPGATLRAVGPHPLRVYARLIDIEGTLDVSGFDAAPVFTLNTPNQPEFGAQGGPGAGRGGNASYLTTTATPQGEAGSGSWSTPLQGGIGGEGGWSATNTSNGTNHRAAGGGGGLFGPAQMVLPGNPEHIDNAGLIALSGVDGAATATGALSGQPSPRAGFPGLSPFVDGNPYNDFFGTKVHGDGTTTVGELATPRAGVGGGAGGDGWYSPAGVYPPVQFIHTHHDKGAGGGGGGGLGILQARRIRIAGFGQILADGGDGAGGENTLFINHVGGGSGAGSGGMLVLQAMHINLADAGSAALQAIGGLGGPGADNQYRAEGAGGNGGPGVIQLHVPGGDASWISMPTGMTLRDLSLPAAHVLDLEQGL